MKIERRYSKGIVIIEPHGRIVGQSVVALRQAILPEVKAYDQPRILINFKHTTRIDSSALGILVQANMIAQKKNGHIGVIHVSRHIKSLLVVSRVTTLFEHFENEVDAVAALSR